MRFATPLRRALWAAALLALAPAASAQFTLTAPADNAVEQDPSGAILFDWADADGALGCGAFDINTNDYYRLELTGPGLAGGAFGTTARNAFSFSQRSVPASTFEYGATYTWEVIARDGGTNIELCRSAAAFTFTTRDLTITTPTAGAVGVDFNGSPVWETYAGSDQADFDHYEVQITGATTITLDTPVPALLLSHVSRLLAPGAHTITIEPQNAANVALLGTYDTHAFDTDALPSLTLPLDNATDVSVESFFSWAGYLGAADYEIEILDAGNNAVVSQIVNGGAFTVPDRATLNPNATYTWTARPQDSNGAVTSYVTRTFTTESLDVTAPADGATGVDFDATFTWEAYAGTDLGDLDHYEVVVTGGSPNTVVTIDNIPAGTLTTSLGLAVDLLVPGTHSVTVVPKDNADAPLDHAYTSNTFATDPAPVLTGAMADGATEVELEATFTWEAYPPATDYTLQITGTAGRDAGGIYSFEVAGATTFTYPLGASDLDYGTTYSWTVLPRLDDESTVWEYAARTFTTIDGPPLNHPLHTLTGVPSEPTFDWTTVNGSNAYRFYLSDDPAFATTALHPSLNTVPNPTYIEVAPRAHTSNHTLQILRDRNRVEADFITNTPGDDVAYADLDNATVYYWKVESIQGGKAIPSATFSFMVNQEAKPVLNDPSDGEDKTILPLTFDWHVPQNVDALTWRIQVREQGVTDWLPADMTIDQSGLTDSDYTSGTNADQLLRNVVYEWRVIASTTAQPNQALSTVTDSDVQTFRVRGGSDTDVYPSWPTGGATVYTNAPRLAYFVTEPGDDLTYGVQVRLASDPDWSTPLLDATGLATFFYDVPAGALDPGADYLWRVRAEYALGGTFSAWSADQAFTTNGPGTPTQPILSFPGDGATVYNTTVALDWYLAAQESGLDYVVTFGPQGGPFADTVSPTTNLTVGGLTPGATYEWSVISRSTADHSITSAPSATFSFTVAGGVGDGTPTASYPSNGATVYSRLPEVNWYVEGNLAGITGYVVQVAEAGTGFAAPISVNVPGANVKSYTLVGGQELDWGGAYEWRVASVGAGGQSAWSTQSFVVTAVATTLRPFVSYPASGEVFKGTSVTVSWYIDQNAAPVQDYVVQYSRTAIFHPADVVEVIVPKTRTFEELTGLVAGATYQWRVRARLTDGQNSGWSSPVGSFVLEAGANAPVPLVGSPINNVLVRASEPSLAWAIPVASTSTLTYDLELSTSPDLKSPIRAFELPNANAVLGTLEPGTYYWRVRTVASSGHVSGWSSVATFRVGLLSTDVEEAAGDELPTRLALAPSYPNPLSTTTTIGYDLPEATDVTLTVYNALGQRVRTLVRGLTEAGSHAAEWDGRDDGGSLVANGLYIYRLEAGRTQHTRTLLVVR